MPTTFYKALHLDPLNTVIKKKNHLHYFSLILVYTLYSGRMYVYLYILCISKRGRICTLIDLKTDKKIVIVITSYK